MCFIFLLYKQASSQILKYRSWNIFSEESQIVQQIYQDT